MTWENVQLKRIIAMTDGPVDILLRPELDNGFYGQPLQPADVSEEDTYLSGRFVTQWYSVFVERPHGFPAVRAHRSELSRMVPKIRAFVDRFREHVAEFAEECRQAIEASHAEIDAREAYHAALQAQLDELVANN